MSNVLCFMSNKQTNVQCLREAFERYLIVSNDKGHKSYGPKIVITFLDFVEKMSYIRIFSWTHGM